MEPEILGSLLDPTILKNVKSITFSPILNQCTIGRDFTATMNLTINADKGPEVGMNRGGQAVRKRSWAHTGSGDAGGGEGNMRKHRRVESDTVEDEQQHNNHNVASTEPGQDSRQKGGVKSETVPLDTVNTTELGAHQKSHTLQPVSPVQPELVTLLKDFLAAQQRRMEGLAEEIRVLKNSILAVPLFAAEVTCQSRQSSSVSPQERPRRQVLTPGPRQQYRTASSTSTANTALAERALNRTASTAQHVRRGESETPS
ncbi:uncharacterized protein LOC135248628 isoform X2 [Anguilla rostrata]|uniref:uncharacterized protein LOC135248628 isoform X2 n=1 Tax=Anguilla rostrata TaxID=7938 RepID=UPI0030D566CE